MTTREATSSRSDSQLSGAGANNYVAGSLFNQMKRGRTDSLEQNNTATTNKDTPSVLVNDEPVESVSNVTVVNNPGYYAREKEHLTFKLDKLNDKKCRYESHEAFLDKCLTNNLIPNGLKVYVEPSIGNRDEQFLAQWHTRLDEFSRTLTSDVIAFCGTELTKTKDEIAAVNLKLKELTTASGAGSEFKDITNAIAANQRSRVNELTQRKNRKFYNLKYKNNNEGRMNQQHERNLGQERDRNGETGRIHRQENQNSDSRDRWDNKRSNWINDRQRNPSEQQNRRDDGNHRSRENEQNNSNQGYYGNQQNQRDYGTRPGLSYAGATNNERRNGNHSRRPSYRNLAPSNPNEDVPLSERISLHRRNSKRNVSTIENHGTTTNKDKEIEELRRRLNQLESGEKEKVTSYQILQRDIPPPPKNTNEAQRTDMSQSNTTDITEMKSFLMGVMETIKEFDKRLTNLSSTVPIHSEK